MRSASTRATSGPPSTKDSRVPRGRRLPVTPVQARLIRLRFLEARTLDETAVAVGMALSTTYDQMAHAVRALRRRIESPSEISAP